MVLALVAAGLSWQERILEQIRVLVRRSGVSPPVQEWSA